MCEFWLYSCGHTFQHACRAHTSSVSPPPAAPGTIAAAASASGDAPGSRLATTSRAPIPPQTTATASTTTAPAPNIAYGFGQGFYAGQTGVSENLAPPPVHPSYDRTRPITAVQVYSKKKAGKHTELLTIPVQPNECPGMLSLPRRTEDPCFKCLLAGRGDGAGGPGESEGVSVGVGGSGAPVAVRSAPEIVRESLNDFGAHEVGGKFAGPRVKVFGGKGVRKG
ncbi:MAG: hypothetical protein Q9160_003185 [Pyrenula sp. 1 TL-2023]